MNPSSSAAVNRPEPEVPERNLPLAPGANGAPQGVGNSVVYPRLLWLHSRLLTRVVLCGFLASIVIALLIPPRYESTAQLMPPDDQSSSSLAMAAAVAGGGIGGIASDLLNLKSSSDVFVGILTSRTVEDELIQQFDLKKLYGDRRMEDARKALADRTSIGVDRKSQIITITVTDKSPQRAAAMAQAYVEELNRLVAELSTSSARRERIFLEGRLQAVTQDLEAAEKDFSQFASKNSAIDVKAQGNALVQAAATLQGQYIAAQSEYEGLKQIYTDNNVRVRSVKARINELKVQLDKLGGKGESSTEASGPSDDSLYPSIRKLPLLGVTFADLSRRTMIQEAVLETLTKEYEMAKVQEAKEIPTVKVLDAPQIPDKKSFPPRGLIVLLGTTFALAAATTWVFGKTAWAQTDANDPRKVFAQEVFTAVKARIPQFTHNGSGDSSGTSNSWGRDRRQRDEHETSE